jgi:hypothetical protein
MDTPIKIADRSRWLQDCNSMLISALCNLSVMVVLGLMTAAASDEWGGVTLMANAGGPGDTASFDDSPLEESVKLDASTDSAAALGPISMFDAAVTPTSDLAALESLAQKSGKLSGLEGLALGGSGAANGASGLAATEFFGIGGYGQTFVYVVDASDSMNENGKFDRARYELLHSIDQLASDQRYFVIFFNDAAFPMDATEPVMATEEARSETAAWVDGTTARDGTNPLPALLYALSLRPDAIFFLSDGQFDPRTITILRARNRPTKRVGQRQIPIHTIAFVDHSTVGLMRTIARDSNGDHRFVK